MVYEGHRGREAVNDVEAYGHGSAGNVGPAHGACRARLRPERRDGRLGGEIDLGDNEVLSVDGTIDGAMLRFVIVVPDLDGDQPINFEGVLAGDTITGAEGSFSWYGTGDWTASRK